jgi:hypothetical protein
VKPETKNEFLEWTAEVQCGELIQVKSTHYSNITYKIKLLNNFINIFLSIDKWVPVITVWRVLRLRVEERPPILVAANIFNTQSRKADKEVVLQVASCAR